MSAPNVERCPCCGGVEWDGVPGGRYCRKCRITYFDLPLAQSRHDARVAEAEKPGQDLARLTIETCRDDGSIDWAMVLRLRRAARALLKVNS